MTPMSIGPRNTTQSVDPRADMGIDGGNGQTCPQVGSMGGRTIHVVDGPSASPHGDAEAVALRAVLDQLGRSAPLSPQGKPLGERSIALGGSPS